MKERTDMPATETFNRAAALARFVGEEQEYGALKPSAAVGARLHGVAFIAASNTVVCCLQCGSRWAVDAQRGGRLPARWWLCPEGCNEEQICES
jgi:hypothetical protein